jgi:ABC-2 type transport system permease protein
MPLLEDSITLFMREMLIFKANLRTNLIRSVIFPIIIIVFFGNIGSSPQNVPIAVVNLANNLQSTQFIQQLSASASLQLSAVTGESSALGMLSSGKVAIVVIILPTFPSSNPDVAGIQMYYSNTQQAVAAVGIQAISSLASKFTQSVKSSVVAPASVSAPSHEIVAEPLFGTASSYKTFLAGGVIPMVIIFGALFGSGMSLISDRQLGNLKAFFITPINKRAIVLSRIFSGAVQGLIFGFVALSIGLLDGATIAMSPLLAILYITAIILLISASFSGIAIMLASKIKRVDAFGIFAQVVTLPLWFISGGIVPIQSLPGWLQTFSAFDPLTYANTITRGVMIQGSISPSLALMNFGLLAAFTVVCILLSFRIFMSSSGID